jgi:hypothetical protein
MESFEGYRHIFGQTDIDETPATLTLFSSELQFSLQNSEKSTQNKTEKNQKIKSKY